MWGTLPEVVKLTLLEATEAGWICPGDADSSHTAQAEEGTGCAS